MFGSSDKKRFLVCGLGTVGKSVADTLDKLNYYVVGLDIKEEVVADIRRNPDLKFLCFCADVLNPRFMEDMKELGSFDVAILTMEDLLGRIVCTKILQRAGVKHIVSRATNEMEEEILRDLKVERFEHVKENLGKHMAHISLCKYILDYDYIDLQQTEVEDEAANVKAGNYTMLNMRVPESFDGDTIDTIKKKLSFGKAMKVVAVHFGAKARGVNNPYFCNNESFIDSVVSHRDTLLVCGPEEGLEELIKELAKLEEN